jgi:hypothetical protein
MAGERVLVVDDSKQAREFAADYVLKPNGFEPIWRATAPRACAWRCNFRLT